MKPIIAIIITNMHSDNQPCPKTIERIAYVYVALAFIIHQGITITQVAHQLYIFMHFLAELMVLQVAPENFLGRDKLPHA